MAATRGAAGMSLRARLERLRRRVPTPEPCPDHFPEPAAVRHIDYREGM